MLATTLSHTSALRVGAVSIDPPVVLAPMAGITNAAFRQLCREQVESRPAALRRSEPSNMRGTTPNLRRDWLLIIDPQADKAAEVAHERLALVLWVSHIDCLGQHAVEVR